MKITIKGSGRGHRKVINPTDLKFQFDAKDDKEAIRKATAVLKALELS